MTDSMVRWVMLMLVCATAVGFERVDRGKRQVTYHIDEHHEASEDDDDHSVQPVTKKPLPSQVVYPGDLSSFYTTNSPLQVQDNETSTTDPSSQRSQQKRSVYSRRRSDTDKEGPSRTSKSSRNKDMTPQESRLHSSYHKPSVSIMNDVPVEMSFDGAGFLRHEDEDSSEQKDSESTKRKKSRGRNSDSEQDNNRALDDFRKVFNLTRDRMPEHVKYDDEGSYQMEPTQYKSNPEVNPEKAMEFGTQTAENSGSPFAMNFMTSYQNAYQNQFQNPFQGGLTGNTAFNYVPSQMASAQQNPSYDPFTFNFPTIFSGQQQTNINPGMNQMQGFGSMGAMQNMNQMPNLNPMPNMNQMQGPTGQMQNSGLQQESYMQNHRMPSMANPGGVSSMYANVPQQNFNSNPVYQQNMNAQPSAKPQRKRRSVSASQDSEEVQPSASEPNEDHYRRSPSTDQQDASSGFIPINFNGGSIQLSFPFYGQSPMSAPSYSSHPIQPVPMYSMPIHPEGRQYGGMERFYHPSEARRYSYGVLGSGNFEVIRGGLFPGERQQNYNSYQDGRVSYSGDYGNHNGGGSGGYGNQGNDFGNFGTTEIIIDGPIQGFQGFDNFPAHLINALSKHSEISLHPNHRDSDVH